jgi:outer membrane protein OmpA-like peptidoglycan-associated protein
MRQWQTFAATVAGIALAAGLALSASVPSYAQQRPTEEQMLNALKAPPPSVKTRGLTTDTGRTDSARSDERRFIDSVRKIKTRQLTLGEREKVYAIAQDKPNIDLEVYFDYNSASITPDAEAELKKLGRVLTNPELKGGVFFIGGHTDAKGGDDYNQRLSQRRATAVKKYLMENFDLPDDSLVAAGYGEEKLKNTSDPFAAENRRVQIANFEQKSTAQRD